MDLLLPWRKIHIPHAKRKYPNPFVYESTISLRQYQEVVSQLVVRDNSHEQPAFLITNDFDSAAELIVGNYSRLWRVENGITDAENFFQLNALSSPILIKVHFDIVMTMIADTLYGMLANHLRGFEQCDAPKLYRHFIQGKGTVALRDNELIVTYPHRAHNPILQ